MEERIIERARLAEIAHERTYAGYKAEMQALDGLTQAVVHTVECQHKLRKAVEYSAFSMLGRSA